MEYRALARYFFYVIKGFPIIFISLDLKKDGMPGLSELN